MPDPQPAEEPTTAEERAFHLSAIADSEKVCNEKDKLIFPASWVRMWITFDRRLIADIARCDQRIADLQELRSGQAVDIAERETRVRELEAMLQDTERVDTQRAGQLREMGQDLKSLCTSLGKNLEELDAGAAENKRLWKILERIRGFAQASPSDGHFNAQAIARVAVENRHA